MADDRKEYFKEYSRSYCGWLTIKYKSMRFLSKQRNHPMPSFTKQELRQWILNQKELFDKLWQAWVDSGYQKDFAVSINRLDDYKPYTFDNMELTTWKDNLQKGRQCDKTKKAHAKVGKIYGKINGIKSLSKPILQYDLDGNFIAEYYSCIEAARQINGYKQHISSVARGKRKTAHGFKWIYNN